MGSSFLGFASSVSVSKTATTIIGDSSFQNLVKARIRELISKISVNESIHSGKAYFESLGRLRGRLGILILGAGSGSSLRVRRSLIDAALVALRHSLIEGLVAGGSILVPNLLKGVKFPIVFLNSMFSRLCSGVWNSCSLVARTCLMENASLNRSLVMLAILRSTVSNFGVELLSRTFGDLVVLGIVEDVKSRRLLISFSSSLSVVLSSTAVLMCRKN